MFEWFKKFIKSSAVKVDFIERDDLHTRLVISAPKMMNHDPNVQKVRLEFRIYDKQGALQKQWSETHKASTDVVLDSKKFRPEFKNPKTFHLSIPFSGTLQIEHALIFKNGKSLKLSRDLKSKGMSVEYYS